MTQLVIETINAVPDEARLLIMPTLRVLTSLFGLQLWEDGSVSP